ncbi:MAG TPA: TraR/DksA family transcriptional regulator [Solirubrobacteraceae bacterium]|nr:TraR/DksA family transcriptional regulator [Solirubrobacteraceae bacterium]
MDAEHARELLARERARIEHALAGLTRGSVEDVPDPSDASDAGEELFEQELAEGETRALREELEAIARAERRLADGTYGISVHSGEPIPDARLEAVPWAERTAEEQAQLDARGG